MTTGMTDILTAEALAGSPDVAAAIEAIIGRLQQTAASIDGVRPPVAAAVEPYERLLQRHEQIKGRPPYYPYLGSGLGRGPLVQLADGSVKWDMINGIGVHMFGHGDGDLIATALRAAISDVTMEGNLQFDRLVVDFADLLLAEAGRSSKLKHCFLINSGALANESAIKICFQRNAPASRIIAFEGCFAGRTTTMAQITDSPSGRVGLPATVAVDYVPFFDADDPGSSAVEARRRLERLIERYPGGHACFVMELIQGEGGFKPAPRDFFVPLMELCRANGIGVVVDEIQTFGRTTSMFHFEQLRLGDLVDVVTVGKISQVCACLYTAAYNPQPGLLSATFVGSTVALAVGLRMLSRLRDGGYYGPDGRIERLQEAFKRRGAALIQRHPQWFPPARRPDGGTSQTLVEAVGGMMRLTPFGGRRDAVSAALAAMYREGLIAFSCGRGPYHVRFLPPVGVMEPEHFDGVFEVVEAGLAATAREER